MNCHEARELLFAFLDNELDSAASLEMQRHLERCPACAHEAEIERTIGKRLALALEQPSDARALNERQLLAALSARGDAAVPPRRPRQWRWATAACLALALVGAALFSFVRPNHAGHVPRDALVDDFDEFVARGRPVQIASTDREQVADWVGHELHANVELPTMRGQCKLIGARKCDLAGRPGALISYDVGGQPASLLVLTHGDLDYGGMTKADSAHWIDRCKGHTLIAFRRGDLTYVAVAQLPQSQLLELVPD